MRRWSSCNRKMPAACSCWVCPKSASSRSERPRRTRRYARDLELGRQLLVEIAPVVGGAFLWRSTARVLVGLLPGLLGMLPKTAVTYTGTYVVGQTARYYYRFGRRPPPELARELREEAARVAGATLARFPRR